MSNFSISPGRSARAQAEGRCPCPCPCPKSRRNRARARARARARSFVSPGLIEKLRENLSRRWNYSVNRCGESMRKAPRVGREIAQHPETRRDPAGRPEFRSHDGATWDISPGSPAIDRRAREPTMGRREVVVACGARACAARAEAGGWSSYAPESSILAFRSFGPETGGFRLVGCVRNSMGKFAALSAPGGGSRTPKYFSIPRTCILARNENDSQTSAANF